MSDPQFIEDLEVSYRIGEKFQHVKFQGSVEVNSINWTPWIPRLFDPSPRPPGTTEVDVHAHVLPNESGVQYTLSESPEGPWTSNGIHTPTMEAVLLVLSTFVGLDAETLERFRGAVEGGGPLS